MNYRAARVPCVLALVCSALLSVAAPRTPTMLGQVRFVKEADTGFDAFTDSPSPDQAEWMRSTSGARRPTPPTSTHARPGTRTPGPTRTLYAIYAHGNDEVTPKHPEWILRRASGNASTSRTAAAAAPARSTPATSATRPSAPSGSPARKETLAHGYSGLFVDDVNMELRRRNGKARKSRRSTRAPARR